MLLSILVAWLTLLVPVTSGNKVHKQNRKVLATTTCNVDVAQAPGLR